MDTDPASSSAGPAPPLPAQEVAVAGLPIPSQSPLYRAMHSNRYRRQELIGEIQRETRTPLICLIYGDRATIGRPDVLPVADLLHRVPADSDLDVLLQTYGGDIDAAMKLLHLLRRATGTSGRLRVFVPDAAKSAGTLIVLGADHAVLSDTSELGPIDPLVQQRTAQGARQVVGAQAYLDAFADTVANASGDQAADIWQQLLDRFDPVLIPACRAALDRSRRYAEEALKTGMFRGGTGNYTAVAADLADTKRWLTHGAVISADDAVQIGLAIDQRPRQDRLWQAIWRLYCLQVLELHGEPERALFESDFASLDITM